MASNITSSQQWARSLFKGRIGEAVVESVLSEFGYQVERSGREDHRLPTRDGLSPQQIFAPDLAVTDPESQATKYIEVKLRASRPMSVLLQQSRLENLRRFYPGTILAFVSSYDGSVNCADVDELSPNNVITRPDGFCEFDLLRRRWMPIWHFFPKVQPGAKLQQLWADLKGELHGFAEFRVARSKELESFPGEMDELKAFIADTWGADMNLYASGPDNLEELSLDQLWDVARRIDAFLFALDLLGEENIGVDAFTHTVDRMLGEKREKYVAFDVRELRKALLPYPELVKQLDQVMFSTPSKSELTQSYFRIPSEQAKWLRDEFFPSIPTGVGKAYLLPEQGSLDEAIEIDFRTFVSLMRKRNRLDREENRGKLIH